MKAVNELAIMKIVIEMVAEQAGITEQDIKRRTRLRQFVDARRVFAVIVRHTHLVSYEKIGKYVGKSLSAITSYIRTHQQVYNSDSEYKLLYDSCVWRLEKRNSLKNITIEYDKKDPEHSFELLAEENRILKEKLYNVAVILNIENNERDKEKVCV